MTVLFTFFNFLQHELVPVPWRSSGYHYDCNTFSNSFPTTTTAQLPFNVLNLRYDLTPIGNISVVATETGLTPPTSIPVLMREIQSDLLQVGTSKRPTGAVPSVATPSSGVSGVTVSGGMAAVGIASGNSHSIANVSAAVGVTA